MKTILLTSFLLSLSLFQTNSIIGKWNYSKFETKKILDDESKAFANNAFSKFSFEFREDSTYDFQKNRKKESGTWKHEGELITTVNSAGFSEKLKFIQKHNDTIRLEIEKGEFIVFHRSN
jgi:hypothetical protein